MRFITFGDRALKSLLLQNTYEKKLSRDGLHVVLMLFILSLYVRFWTEATYLIIFKCIYVTYPNVFDKRRNENRLFKNLKCRVIILWTRKTYWVCWYKQHFDARYLVCRCSTIPHLPGCFCPWTFFQNIGFNTVLTDPFMSHLATQLGYFAGGFQALQLIVLAAFGVVD